MKNWNNETRKLGIEKIARRLIDLGGTLGQDIDVRLSYEKTLSELVQAVSEESYIVKAARLLIRSWRCVPSEHSDLNLLCAEIAKAGPPPYEQGTGTETENDWVAPLRAELEKRNR